MGAPGPSLLGTLEGLCPLRVRCGKISPRSGRRQWLTACSHSLCALRGKRHDSAEGEWPHRRWLEEGGGQSQGGDGGTDQQAHAVGDGKGYGIFVQLTA